MTNLCVLSYSSASAERIFSMVNCLKTKVTNKLKVETVKNRLLAKQNVAKNNASCCIWEPRLVIIKDLESGTVYRRYENRNIKEEKNGLANINIQQDGGLDEKA